MLRTLKTRVARGRYGKDEGFTLIELMVVVLIIAILLAIAIPTFLGAQNKAKDRSAQASLTNTLTLAKAANADLQDYAAVNATLLIAAEKSIKFSDDALSTDPKTVSVKGVASPADSFTMAAWSKSSKCWFMRETLANGTQYALGTDAAQCKATGTPATTTVDGTSAVWHAKFPSP